MDTFANLYTNRLVNDIANQLATFHSTYKVQTHERLGGTSTQQKKGTLSVSPLINTMFEYIKTLQNVVQEVSPMHQYFIHVD